MSNSKRKAGTDDGGAAAASGTATKRQSVAPEKKYTEQDFKNDIACWTARIAYHTATFSRRPYYGQSTRAFTASTGESTLSDMKTAAAQIRKVCPAQTAALYPVHSSSAAAATELPVIRSKTATKGELRDDPVGPVDTVECAVEYFRKLVEYAIFNSDPQLLKDVEGDAKQSKAAANTPGDAGLSIVDLVVTYALTFQLVFSRRRVNSAAMMEAVESEHEHGGPVLDDYETVIPTTVYLAREVHPTNPYNDRTVFQVEHNFVQFEHRSEGGFHLEADEQPYFWDECKWATIGFRVDIPKTCGQRGWLKADELRRGHCDSPEEAFYTNDTTVINVIQVDLRHFLPRNVLRFSPEVNAVTVFDNRRQIWNKVQRIRPHFDGIPATGVIEFDEDANIQSLALQVREGHRDPY